MGNRQASKKQFHRCRVENSVQCEDPEVGRVIGKGQIVCLAEVVGTKKDGTEITLGELVRDLKYFEELEAGELQAEAELEDPAPSSSSKTKTKGGNK